MSYARVALATSLHADVAVPAHRRDRLEHLARYLLRPALALERFDGDLRRPAPLPASPP